MEIVCGQRHNTFVSIYALLWKKKHAFSQIMKDAFIPKGFITTKLYPKYSRPGILRKVVLVLF